METIKGYDNYQIDREGNIWSKKRKKFMKPCLNSGGYLKICLCKEGKEQRFSIHRLLALQFFDNPDNLPQVDHRNQDKLDNNLENLRWVTKSQNQRNKNCIKGYCWDKCNKKYKARYGLNNKMIHIGYYEKEEEARNAYLNAIKDL